MDIYGLFTYGGTNRSPAHFGSNWFEVPLEAKLARYDHIMHWVDCTLETLAKSHDESSISWIHVQYGKAGVLPGPFFFWLQETIVGGVSVGKLGINEQDYPTLESWRCKHLVVILKYWVVLFAPNPWSCDADLRECSVDAWLQFRCWSRSTCRIFSYTSQVKSDRNKKCQVPFGISYGLDMFDVI